MTVSTSTPYNIREKQEKNAAYRSLIRAELADELYEKILNIIIIGKRYRDKRFSDMTIEEIGTMVGFANRQSFYAAFYRIAGETPNNYRKKHTAAK